MTTAVDPTPIPIGDSLARVLDDITAHLKRYVVFGDDAQAIAVSLWLAYSHALKGSQKIAPPFDHAPYLLVTSPERVSGKTTLRDVMAPIAARGIVTDGITPAAMLRLLANRPTLFIDEIDTIFRSERGDNGQDNETIRALLNSGFKSNGVFMKVVVAKDAIVNYPTFGPKALFGIGNSVPETVTSRSIRLRLQRKERATPVEQARSRRIEADGAAFNKRLRGLMGRTTLKEVPEDEFDKRLTNRTVQLWEPLYAVARAAGGPWPDLAESASISLSTGDAEEDDLTIGQQLLSDVMGLWDDATFVAHDVLLTDLIGHPEDTRDGTPATGLCALEDRQWGEYRGGRLPITAHRVAKTLKGYGIRPKRMRVGTKQGTAVGKTEVEQAARRYLQREAAPPTPPPSAPSPPSAPAPAPAEADDWPLPWLGDP